MVRKLSGRLWASIFSVFGARSAAACVLAVSGDLLADGTHTGSAPGGVTNVVVRVTRGVGPVHDSDGTSSASSCDGAGTVALTFDGAPDPDSSETELGYRVSVVDGTIPDTLEISGGAVRAMTVDGGREFLSLNWNDGATNAQEPLDFSVTLTAVDSHGNEGPESARIRVQDPGRSGDASDGCSIRAERETGGSGVLVAAAIALGAGLYRRRKCR